MKRIYAIIISLATTVILLDQWSKHYFASILQFEGDSIPVFDWWNWTLVYNRAAAFGMFSKVPFLGEDARIYFLLLVPIAVLVLLYFMIIKNIKKGETFRPIFVGLVVGGALGNIIDRIHLKYVIDFIDWFYPASTQGKCLPFFFQMNAGTECHWPVFNVADVAINIAMILYLVYSFKYERKQKKA